MEQPMNSGIQSVPGHASKAGMIGSAVVLLALGLVAGYMLGKNGTTSVSSPTPTSSVSPSSSATPLWNQSRAPQFSDFSVASAFSGVSAAVDYSSDSTGATYKTQYTTQVPKGPNFAGHYTVVTWGCGSNCIVYTIVDNMTGTIYPGGGSDTGDVQFQKNSSLIIEKNTNGSKFYVWQDNTLELVYTSISSTPSASPSTVSNRVQDGSKLKVGDMVGSMKVTAVNAMLNGQPLSAENVSLVFSGKVEVTGKYTVNPENYELGSGDVCFFNLDAASLAKLPIINSIVDFCISNKVFAHEKLGPGGTQGSATIVIDNRRIQLCGCEGLNDASLVEVKKRTN